MSLFKSRQRVADHGEVFTPAWMVEANTGIESHEGLTHFGLYDTVVGRD